MYSSRALLDTGVNHPLIIDSSKEGYSASSVLDHFRILARLLLRLPQLFQTWTTFSRLVDDPITSFVPCLGFRRALARRSFDRSHEPLTRSPSLTLSLSSRHLLRFVRCTRRGYNRRKWEQSCTGIASSSGLWTTFLMVKKYKDLGN
jgi:hypothetical protein